MIAITHPGKIGDLLWALPVMRWLSTKHGCQADFYTSSWGAPAVRLLERQTCIRRACVVAEYTQVGDGPGIQPWLVPISDKSDYEAVYHLGMRSNPDCVLRDYYARLVGAPDGLPLYYDFDDQREISGDYVILAARGETSFRPAFEDFVRRCPYPVVQIGAVGECIGGGVDCTGRDLLDTIPLIAHCRAFVGMMSSQLVLANAFPCVKIAPHDGVHWDMRHVLYSQRNHYPISTSADDFLGRVRDLPTLSKTLDPNDYWSLCYDTPLVDEAANFLAGLFHPPHPHRRWEYGLALQALRRHGAKRVLDIGGGGSLFAGALAINGYEVDVNDPNDYTSWIVAQRDKIGNHIGFLCGLMEHVQSPYPAVTCLSTIEHIVDHEYAWRHLLRLVEPGGLLVLTTDYHESGGAMHPGHLRTYNQPLLQKLLNRADGFELFGGPPAYQDGGAEVHGYNFASLVLRRTA